MAAKINTENAENVKYSCTIEVAKTSSTSKRYIIENVPSSTVVS